MDFGEYLEEKRIKEDRLCLIKLILKVMKSLKLLK